MRKCQKWIPAFLAMALGLLAGCRTSVVWKKNVVFSAFGTRPTIKKLAKLDTERLILPNKHYVSIAVDAVFFRDLPKITYKPVALGIGVEGIGKTPVRMVARCCGKGKLVQFDNVAVVEPTLYKGQEIELQIIFRGLLYNEETEIRDRFAGSGQKWINPFNPAQTDNVLLAPGPHTCTYPLIFRAHGKSHELDPGIPLATGRYVMMVLPPNAAAPRLGDLKLLGNQLVWARSGEYFNDNPYVLLNIVRYKRYPQPKAPIKLAEKVFDNLLSLKKIGEAAKALKALKDTIVGDIRQSDRERELAKAYYNYRSEQLKVAQALKEGNNDLAERSLERQAKALRRIKKDFKGFLQPAEIMDINYRLKHLPKIEPKPEAAPKAADTAKEGAPAPKPEK